MREASFGSDRLDYIIGLEDDRQASQLLISPLLIPHPEDEISDDDAPSPRLMGGRDYIRQNIYMVTWQFTLFLGYLVQRMSCRLGVPSDCLKETSYFEFFSDITCLALYGLALGWLVGITEHSRFRWLYSPKRWYAGVAFLGTPVVYSALSNIDALKHDFADVASWGIPFVALWSTGMTVIVFSIIWHIKKAWQRAGPATFATYICLRGILLGWFVISALLLAHSSSTHVKIHLHHLYLGWALALWADVNEPFSAYTLAIGAGIFCQGIAAYSFAPIFTEQGCFDTPASSSVKCSFKGESPFTLRVCPQGGIVPQYQCTTGSA